MTGTKLQLSSSNAKENGLQPGQVFLYLTFPWEDVGRFLTDKHWWGKRSSKKTQEIIKPGVHPACRWRPKKEERRQKFLPSYSENGGNGL